MERSLVRDLLLMELAPSRLAIGLQLLLRLERQAACRHSQEMHMTAVQIHETVGCIMQSVAADRPISSPGSEPRGRAYVRRPTGPPDI